ncbi:MAG TPA: hypothetical protein VF131_20680 [Blastocatellia bacterium]|nr:hypothetical protein [Blastocatellia bacterium]
MRLIIVSIIMMSLLLLPANGLASQAETRVPDHQGCRTSSCPGVQTRITLKNGKKITGELHREKSDQIEIHRNGKVEIIPRSEIKRVAFGKTFWQKIKSKLGWVRLAPEMALAYVYLLIVCGGVPDKCFDEETR